MSRIIVSSRLSEVIGLEQCSTLPVFSALVHNVFIPFSVKDSQLIAQCINSWCGLLCRGLLEDVGVLSDYSGDATLKRLSQPCGSSAVILRVKGTDDVEVGLSPMSLDRIRHLPPSLQLSATFLLLLRGCELFSESTCMHFAMALTSPDGKVKMEGNMSSVCYLFQSSLTYVALVNEMLSVSGEPPCLLPAPLVCLIALAVHNLFFVFGGKGYRYTNYLAFLSPAA